MMKKPAFTSIFLLLLSLIVVCSNARAQIADEFRETGETATPNRAQILRTLGLTLSQLQRIRQINREFQPPLRHAAQRMQAANLALDTAVYGGAAGDQEIQSKLREAQTAHSEWLRARTASERAIASVLNPAQLVRFRELQRLRKRANLQNRRLNRQTQPIPPRLNRLPRRLRNRRNPAGRDL